MDRFTARLSGLSAADAERVPADGEWSAAQVAWHVAAVNRSFAAIVDGTIPISKPAPEGFSERDWVEIGGGVPEKAQAPSRVQPQGPVTREEALQSLADSRDRLVAALRSLDPARAVLTIDTAPVGCISLYQVGEWAQVHVIRHNKQMKRVAGQA